MRIATFNVNSIKMRAASLAPWLVENHVDLIALQETKTIEEAPFKDYFLPLGYECYHFGQRSYNGVAILNKTRSFASSKLTSTNIPGYHDPQVRLVAVQYTTHEGVSFIFINAYFPNGQAIGSDKFAYKLDWISTLNAWIRTLKRAGHHIILAGDMNIAPHDTDVWSPEAWKGNILVSAAERKAYARLLASGLRDVWEDYEHEPGSYTWWDYRFDSFSKNHGARIDHILVDQALAPAVTDMYIDTSLRKGEKPSDHTPLWMDFDFSSAHQAMR